MLIEHRGAAPDVHPTAYVAPTAVLCGAVRAGPETRILFGAVLTAEDGEIQVGAHCVVMENAVLGPGSEVRIHGVVQVNTVLAAGGTSRSAGWRSATRPGSTRPASTSRSGPFRRDSTSPARCMASAAIPRRRCGWPGRRTGFLLIAMTSEPTDDCLAVTGEVASSPTKPGR